MSIPDWPEDDRPREKLLAKGAAALTDSELLAIFLRVGAEGKSAVDLARELLREFGSVAQLIAADRARVEAIKGMGEAKYCQLQASIELARRALGNSLSEQPVFSQPAMVEDYLRLRYANKTVECFCVTLLTTQLSLIDTVTLSEGTLNTTAVYPREIVKLVLLHNADAVIISHNHPMGDSQPSKADIQITAQIAAALSSIHVRLLDHVIVGQTAASSMQALGLMPR